MRRILIPTLVASFAFAASAFAQAPAYTLVKEKSSIKFFAIQNNAPVEGEFKDFTVDIHFNPDKPEESTIVAEVDTGSATSANDDVTSTVKLPEWLSAQAFPKATFTTKKITRMPNSDNYYSEGTLTLRGKTMPVELNFQVQYADAKNALATGSITIRRTDFGVGQGAWAKDDVVKKEVRVEFRIAAVKQ